MEATRKKIGRGSTSRRSGSGLKTPPEPEERKAAKSAKREQRPEPEEPQISQMSTD
jgi:hypothetical protein